MINVYLMRHGEVKGGSVYRGSQDDPLTKTGIQQMQNALQILPTSINHVFCSPLQRCLSFAQNSTPLSSKLIVEPNFKEIHFGEWEGKRFDQITATNLKRYFKNPYANTPPQAEKLIHFETRVTNAWNNIINKQNNTSNSLIITHAGVIRALLKHCLDISFESAFNINIGHASVVHLKVGFEDKQAFVQLINLTNQLD